jgi:hypothetical protein
MDDEIEHPRIKELCEELASIFPGDCFVTILVRDPDDPKQGMLVTEDEVEEIIPAIQRFAYRQ